MKWIKDNSVLGIVLIIGALVSLPWEEAEGVDVQYCHVVGSRGDPQTFPGLGPFHETRVSHLKAPAGGAACADRTEPSGDTARTAP